MVMTDHITPSPFRSTTHPATRPHPLASRTSSASSPIPSEPPARAANLPDPSSSRFPGDDTPGDVLPSSFSSPSRRRAPPQPAASHMLSLHSHTPSGLPPRTASLLDHSSSRTTPRISGISIPSTFSASIVLPSLTSLRILRQTPHL
jgi:hypothetical protein